MNKASKKVFTFAITFAKQFMPFLGRKIEIASRITKNSFCFFAKFVPEVAEVNGGLDVTPEVVVEQQLEVELDAGGQALQELVASQLLQRAVIKLAVIMFQTILRSSHNNLMII